MNKVLDICQYERMPVNSFRQNELKLKHEHYEQQPIPQMRRQMMFCENSSLFSRQIN